MEEYRFERGKGIFHGLDPCVFCGSLDLLSTVITFTKNISSYGKGIVSKVLSRFLNRSFL